MTATDAAIAGGLIALVLTMVLIAGSLPIVQPAPARRPWHVKRTRRRRHPVPIDMVQLVDQIAREVRSGVGVRSALSTVLHRHPGALVDVRTALDQHLPIDQSLAACTASHDETALVIHALRRGASQPHVLADVLDRTAMLVRERRAWRAERRAHAAQARLSAQVLTFLPIGFAAWGALTSASIRNTYASSTAAQVVSAIGIGLNVVGWFWMRRIVIGDDT